MELLVSRLECLKSGFRSLEDVFIYNIADTRELTIAVGYASSLSLWKLDKEIRAHHVENTDLILGMYYSEGIPDSIYNKAVSLAESWAKDGIGHVYLTVPIHYHGKVYLFEKRNGNRLAVIGSANLTEICPPSKTLQCESSVAQDDDEILSAVEEHLQSLRPFLIDIRDSGDIRKIETKNKVADEIIHEDDFSYRPKKVFVRRTPNVAMEGIKGVEKLSEADLDGLFKDRTGIRFDLPLKVPSWNQRFSDDRKAYAHSNINVCYSKPRVAGGKGRSWYEFQLTVSKSISEQPGYPKKKEQFYIVTDDGWFFLAHVSSGNGRKQLSAVGNELLLGTWVKGRLVSFGLVVPQLDTLKDTERKGLITKEMLDEYGCHNITIEKTEKKRRGPSGDMLSVWLMTFLPESTKKAIENNH